MSMLFADRPELDAYVAAHTTPVGPLLDDLEAATRASLTSSGMLAGPVVGALLRFLVGAVRARTVLEIGTYSGYSSLAMASALPEGGQLITCELDEERAAFARSWFDRSPHGGRIEQRMGPALETVNALDGPFDFVFIDADKPGNAAYFDWAVRLARPGALVVVDNVVRKGEVAVAESGDPNVQGTRALFDAVTTDTRVDATAVQTVGLKGYDGFQISVVGAQ